MVKKSENSEKLEMAKCKKAFKCSNLETAIVHAENVIRHRNDVLNNTRKLNDIDLLLDQYKSFLASDSINNLSVSPDEIIIEIKQKLNRIEIVSAAPVSADDIGKLLYQISSELNTTATVVSMEQEELVRRLARLRRSE